MELLKQSEVSFIAKQCGYSNVLNWRLEEIEDKVIGYLGDHLHLIIDVESGGVSSQINLFVKCMPRFDIWKAKYLKESMFFKKEYIMLKFIFNEFHNPDDYRKWRPKSMLIKEDIFVFENVSLHGYEMPHHQETLAFEELKACVRTLAIFHAQSYIFEERKSKELGRPYRIWEDYSEYLQEPPKGMVWRNVGVNAVIDFLEVFSKYKSKTNFIRYIQSLVPGLYDRAIELMKPSTDYRNVVAHRDLWTNNIFLKKDDTGTAYHALFVDFQTVIYCSPMIDLSTLIYMNTTRNDRTIWTEELIQFYYTVLTTEVKAGGETIEDIIDKNALLEAYDKSIVFAITQASLVTPIVAMSKVKREEIFSNPESSERANLVSRSNEFIDIANEDDKYRVRVTELLDEMAERFVFIKYSGILPST